MAKQIDIALPVNGSVGTNVAAVVVNYNGWEDTVQCIRAIQSSTVAPSHVIVVDNGSTNESWHHLSQLYCQSEVSVASASDAAGGDEVGKIRVQDMAAAATVRLVLMKSERNGGFGAGNNIAVRELKKRGFTGYFWILNSDAEVFPDCLEVLKGLGDSARLPGLIGTTLVDLDCPERVQACGAEMSKVALLSKHLCVGERLERLQAKCDLMYADYPIGASFLLHSSVLQGQDLFDERYFLYFEEVALLQRLGIHRVPIATRAVVKHKGGATTGAFEKPQAWNALADYHSIRSRILFGRQCGTIPAIGAVVSGTAIAFKRFLRVGPKGALNALRGVWSALRTAPPTVPNR